MASLSQTLRQKRQGTLVRGPGGQLSQETPEEIQQLAGQAGLQAPPTTPLGAALIGANKDQQKMQGTPAQKDAALALSQAPVEQGLSGAVRRMQARSQMTQEEEQQKTKSADMQNLGSLGDRVTSFIDAQKQKLQTQAQQAAAPDTALSVATADTFQGKDVSSIKAKLEQFRREPNNQQLLLEINQALGYDINTQLNPAQVQELYESAVDTIARGAAGTIDNDLTVTDLMQQPDFGYSQEELSSLLGLPAEQIAGMNVGQLRAEIERVGQEEFSKSQTLQQQAQSGTLGQAERQLARQAGREMSATGVRATEADYAAIEQSIANADKVQFGGREYNVDELLQDETISNIIKDYMESAPDSEIRRQVDASEPALKEFIEKNQAVLQDASSQMEAGAQEFRDIQAANKQLKNIAGIELSDQVASALIPGFGTLQASRINPEQVPVLQAINSLGDVGKQQAAANQISMLAEEFGLDTIQELGTLTSEQLSRLKLGKIDPNNPGPLTKWMQNQAIRREAESIPPQDLDSIYRLSYDGLNAGKANQLRTNANKLSVFGIQSNLPEDILDPTKAKDTLLNSLPAASLTDAANGYNPTLTKRPAPQVVMPSMSSPEGYWLSLAGDMGDDGNLDAAETAALVSRGIQTQEAGLGNLIQLEDMAGRPGARMDRGVITQKRQEFTDRNTAERINMAKQSGAPAETLLGYLDLVKLDTRIVNKDILRNTLQQFLENELRNNNPDAPDYLRQIDASGIGFNTAEWTARFRENQLRQQKPVLTPQQEAEARKKWENEQRVKEARARNKGSNK